MIRGRTSGADCALWAWLAVLAALLQGRTTAYTDTEDFLSDLDKPGEFNFIIYSQCSVDIILWDMQNRCRVLSYLYIFLSLFFCVRELLIIMSIVFL